MSKQKITLVPIDELHRGENVRLISNESNGQKISSLAADIAANNLTTPLLVAPRSGGGYSILQGFRRSRALEELQRISPEIFADLFGKGIPCVIVEASAEEQAMLHVDHGNIESLTDGEVTLAVRLLRNAGVSDDRAAVRLGGLLDRFSPLNKKQKDDLETARISAIREAQKLGRSDEDCEKIGQAAHDRKYAEIRRGYIQNRGKLLDCPPIVLAAYLFQQSGNLEDACIERDFTAPALEEMPNITFGVARDLAAALGKDMASSPKYRRDNPGPAFDEKLSEITAREAERQSKAAARPKAMNGKDMESAQGSYNSAGFKALIAKLRGQPFEDFNLADSDQMLCCLEAILDSSESDDATLLDQILQRGNDLINNKATKAVSA